MTVGDKLQYVIQVTNKGQNVANNGLIGTTLSDTLPANLSLADNSNTQSITADVGTVAPGKTVTKTYAVTVTGGTNGDIIKDEACFTGNDKSNDSPQKGCDDAYIKVNAQRKEPLPNTGMSMSLTLFIAFGSGFVAYMARLMSFRRRRGSNT